MSGMELIEPTELYNLLNQGTTYPCLSDTNYLLLLGKLTVSPVPVYGGPGGEYKLQEQRRVNHHFPAWGKGLKFVDNWTG